MYTSLALIALANFVAPSPTPVNLHWSGDYWSAQKHAQKQQKPLAVFIASGQNGFNKLSQDGNLPEPVRKILADKYVCVYLDTTTKDSRSLVQQFEITKGLGLVISDRAGTTQAYHHDGDISAGDLAAKLQRFADPNLAVQTTESNIRVSFYPSGQNYTQPAVGRSC